MAAAAKKDSITMASLLAMPSLVVNLGGEMMYILQQRLQAQSIPPEKSKKGVTQFVFLSCFSCKRISNGSFRD
jgi:hypothetical protein